MPSENKTANYALNQWQGNEYPKREDFNSDNAIIDTELKNLNDKADSKISKSFATAASQFLVSSAAGQWAIKTIAEIKTLLGLGSAAYTNSTAYATAAQGIKADNAIPSSQKGIAGGVAAYDSVNAHLSDTTAHGIANKVDATTYNAHASDITHIPHLGTTTNSGNAYSISTGVTIKLNSKFTITFNTASTGPITLTVVGQGGAAPVYRAGNIPAIVKAGTYTLFVNNGNFQLLGEGGEMPKLPNILRNGGFENDFNCFVPRVGGDVSKISISTSIKHSGSKAMYQTISSGDYLQSVPYVVGHKYYLIGYGYFTVPTAAFFIGGVINNGITTLLNVTSSLNIWQRSSILFTCNGPLQIFVGAYSTSQVQNAYYDGFMLFDLTEYFGEGNEPSVEEVNYMVGLTPNRVRNGNCEKGTDNWVNANPDSLILSVENGKFKLVSTVNYKYVVQKVKVKPDTNYYLFTNMSIASGTANIYAFDATVTTQLKQGSGTFNTGSNSEIAILMLIATTGTAYFDSIMLIEGTTVPAVYRPSMPYDWWDSDLPLLTSDADALSTEILNSKIAYVNGNRIVGEIPDKNSANSYATKVSAASGRLYLMPPKGYYNQGATSWVYHDEPNFIPANIPAGMSMFGLAGTNSNKRWAKGTVASSASTSEFMDVSGTTTMTGYKVTISGLTFKPTRICLRSKIYPGVYETHYYEGTEQIDYPKVIRVGVYPLSNQSTINWSLKGDVSPVSVTSSGFTLPVAAQGTYVWEAYE